VFLRYDQEVTVSQRADVQERQYGLVFVNDLSWNLNSDDLAENAFRVA
jgi:hypothetical protein